MTLLTAKLFSNASIKIFSLINSTYNISMCSECLHTSTHKNSILVSSSGSADSSTWPMHFLKLSRPGLVTLGVLHVQKIKDT